MKTLKIIKFAASWIITLLLPMMIVFSIVRGLMTPVFPAIEYNMPGFPDDPYGFTREERLRWARLSTQYLLNATDIRFFEPYSLEDGAPLYNDRELSHMDDVKILVQQGLRVWLITGLLFMLAVLFLFITKDFISLKLGLRNGGFFTMGIIAAILLSVAIDFNTLFTWFHKLFFIGESWIFYYSDTFIRLFPIRFWMDCFIYIGVLSLLLAITAVRLPGKWIK